MIPRLPQNDTENAADRTKYLERNRRLYQFDFNYISPLPLLDTDPHKQGADIIPDRENFSSLYNGEKLAETKLKLAPNLLLAKVRGFFDPFDRLDDYADDIFTTIPLPEIAKKQEYLTDRSFADQRLAGANPVMIRQVKPESDAGKKIAALLQKHQDQFSPIDIAERLANGHIYITDYTGTDPSYPTPASIAGGTYNSKARKYLPKPRAFFCWRDLGISDRGELIPIAIQLNADYESRLYTPSEKNDWDWFFAKLCVQIADANHHEMSTHLCRTHFVLEPFAMSTARQLAKLHPLSLLLAPHLRFLIANNHLGRQLLINVKSRGSIAEKIMAGSLAESAKIVSDSYQNWDFQKCSFLEDLKERGLDNDQRLPHYPYRDDGKLVWNELSKFVTKYLNYFYPNPSDITADSELQGWAQELATVAKVKGMPSSIDNINTLIDIITNLIFISGPFHSAVNYAQNEYMTFIPNQPMAAYLDPQPNPIDLPMSEEQIMKLLPPYEPTFEQFNTIYFLSAYRFDRLGDYERTYQELYQNNILDFFEGTPVVEKIFAGTPINEFISEFRRDLKMVGEEIDQRNKKRVTKYPYFHPDLITNSTSV
jgi:arachidonate 15-lipoxygenase